MVFANGSTMAMAFNLEGLGWTYISLAIVWTLLLIVGSVVVILNRDLPFIRIRNIPLAISAVATLHVYWVLCMIAYTLQGYFPCATEYWIMSIYLPLGIALFHASNTQLLYIAGLQKRYAAVGPYRSEKGNVQKEGKGWRRYFAHLRTQNQVNRTMNYIGYAMLIEFVLALLIFLLSRKFHPSFGVTPADYPGSLADSSQACELLKAKYDMPTCEQAEKLACRRGWEWIPSIIWQFFWAWFYAPYLLWKLREVNDVHGWRKQTIFCCIAGLPASPLWLSALYAPQMKVVNTYYVPPLWFAPSIFLIEAFLIFVPCWQILKNRRLKRETLDIIAEWEQKNNGSSIESESSNTTARFSQKPSVLSSTSSRRGEMYTMTALESALRTNSHPLLLFAALKDFSGENISFLSHVMEWKRNWSPSSPSNSGFFRQPKNQDVTSTEIQRQQFKNAVEIYSAFVSPQHSHFPINISYPHLKELKELFEGPASMLHDDKYGAADAVTPFDDSCAYGRHTDLESSPSRDGLSVTTTIIGKNSTDDDLPLHDKSKSQKVVEIFKLSSSGNALPDDLVIPDTFGPEIFDHAEESIKYMVLTNTWPKFVNAGYANIQRKDFLQWVKGQISRE